MSKLRNAYERKRYEVLGEHIITAQKRLNRMLIFHLFKKLGENNCFQCGFPINDWKEMTIEHKIPWLRDRNDDALFWDMENIRHFT